MRVTMFGPAIHTERAGPQNATVATTCNSVEVSILGSQRKIRLHLGRGGVVSLARNLLANVEMGHMDDVDVHDLKHIEKTIRMLIRAKEDE